MPHVATLAPRLVECLRALSEEADADSVDVARLVREVAWLRGHVEALAACLPRGRAPGRLLAPVLPAVVTGAQAAALLLIASGSAGRGRSLPALEGVENPDAGLYAAAEGTLRALSPWLAIALTEAIQWAAIPIDAPLDVLATVGVSAARECEVVA